MWTTAVLLLLLLPRLLPSTVCMMPCQDCSHLCPLSGRGEEMTECVLGADQKAAYCGVRGEKVISLLNYYQNVKKKKSVFMEVNCIIFFLP